jgi:putative transcriptional regulator
MTVRIRLDQMLHRRRMSLAELADRVGASPAKLALLKTNEAQAIRLTTLDALCRELDCTPGDLLAYSPGDD